MTYFMDYVFLVGLVAVIGLSVFFVLRKKGISEPDPIIPTVISPVDTLADLPTPETIQKGTIEEFMDENAAKEMPLDDFNRMIEGNAIIIEKETHGYTNSFDKWLHSDVWHYVPKSCSPAPYLASGKGSYALADSFMVDGVVYANDPGDVKLKKNHHLCRNELEVREYLDTLYAVYLVYQGVSPIDRTTPRYYVVGVREDEGMVPTHGLQ